MPRHKLIHDVTTRWNTVHDMLERYIEQQPAIYSALLDKDLKLSVKNITMLNDSEQKLAEELIQVLTPLKTVTTLMSSETTPTISMILPLKEMILKSMSPGDQDSATIKEAKAAITNDLAKRYTDPNLHDYLQMATALDPRFKSLPYLDVDSRDKLYRNIIREILEREHQVLYDFVLFFLIVCDFDCFIYLDVCYITCVLFTDQNNFHICYVTLEMVVVLSCVCLYV